MSADPRALALPGRPWTDEDGDQKPETDVWPGWTGLRIAADHSSTPNGPREAADR